MLADGEDEQTLEGSAMHPTKTLAGIAALIILTTLSGCGPIDGSGDGSAGGAMTASGTDSQAVDIIRDRYFRAYPESRVGVVIATEPSGAPFVAIGDLPVDGLRENEIVTFLNPNGRVLTT